MSPLSIKAIGLGAPRIGVALGRFEVSAAMVAWRAGAWRIEWQRTIGLDRELFRGEPDADMPAVLAAALRQICPEARSRYVALHVALPDPAASLAVFSLNDLPRSHDARQRLAQWHFEQLLHLGQDAWEYECQSLGRDGDQALLLAVAAKRAWLDCLRAALREAGLVAWSIDMAACHRFNQLHDMLASNPSGGGLVALAKDYWSFAAWDAGKRLRFVRARWSHGEHDDVGDEVERQIRAYAMGNPTHAVAGIWISGPAPAREELMTVLKTRTDGTPSCVLAFAPDGGTSDAIAAATGR